MKKLFVILALLFSLCLSTACFAATYGSSEAHTPVKVVSTDTLVDNANLLKGTEKAQVETALKAVEQKYNVRCMVYTARSVQGGKARDYARSMVDDVLPNQKAIICVITMSDRQWYIAFNKNMREYAIMQQYGMNYISEDMVAKLKKGNYGDAFKIYATKVDELLAFRAKEGHRRSEDDEFNWEVLVGALAIALFLAHSYRSSLIASMSNVEMASGASEYLLRDTFELQSEKDTYLYTTTTVTPKASSHSGGGGDSGGDGGSGGGGCGGGF